MKAQHLRTWIDISTQAIAHNYKVFRELISSETKLLGVIKSNAYGHELFRFGIELQNLGADWLGVDSITEALALRKIGIKIPILVLGYTLPENFELAGVKNISLAISTFESIKALAKVNKKISVHIKVDTGMHRQGFFVKDAQKVLQEISKLKNIKVDGVFTHFAAAKKPDSSHATEKQIAIFKQAAALVKKYHPKALAHAAATAGTLNYPESHFDMVRIGIGLYGLWPSEETKKRFVGRGLKPIRSGRITSPYLQPVLTWKTIISETKTVEKGERIGYDYTEELKRDSKIAILPIGYWHGYWRAFSSKAYVLVAGIRCKVLGKVSMDMIAVDVTNATKAKVGNEVVLLGKQGKEEVTADELGTIANTSCYEIVTRLNPLIKKNYI